MDVDYQSLYAENYFGHSDGAVSFPEHFPEALAAIVRDVQGTRVLDVGAGNNELVRRLKPLGLGGFSLDLRGDDARSVVAFDLTKWDPRAIASIREKIIRDDAAGAHVTSCLDVLEHIDRKDLPNAIWNLRELTSEWILVSISTRPSSAYNLYHATVLPKRSWRLLLAAAGFEIVPHDRLSDLASCRVYPQDENCWSVNQWRRVDPFRDANDPESYFLLLRRSPHPINHDTFTATAQRLLGREHPAVALPIPLHAETHLVFLLVHYQDLLHYIPFWEALPASRFTVLTLDEAYETNGSRREKAMDAWMRSRGIRIQRVKTLSDFDWEGGCGKRTALISASESTASASHLLCAAFVLEARSRGVKTFQIQHGIWPRASFSEPISVFSEFILTWSDDFEGSFHQPVDSPPQNQFLVTGCAKFDDYARAVPIAMVDILGDWVEEFRHKILVATNLHWPMHHQGAQVLPQLIETAEAMPDTLFVCKLHPVHDLEESGPSWPRNVLMLDEFACLFGGIATPQLVRACDAVVCTLTSVALEAALAGRPFLVLDTGNPNHFQGVTEVPIPAMKDAVAAMLIHGATDRDHAFRDHYFAPENFGKGLIRILETIEEMLATAGQSQQSFDAIRAFSSRYANMLMEIWPKRVAKLELEILAEKTRVAELFDKLQSATDAWTRTETNLRDTLRDQAEILASRELELANLAKTAAELEARILRDAHRAAELTEAQREIELLRANLEPYQEIGPASLGIARRAQRLSHKFPRLSSTFKQIVKR